MEQRVGGAMTRDEPNREPARAAREPLFAGMRRRIADWGYRRALNWQLMHALRRIGVSIHYVRIGADRIDLRDQTPPELPPGYEVRFGTKADFLPWIGRIPSLDEEFVHAAFARKDEASIVLFHGDLVHFTFVSRVRARVSAQLDVVVPKGFRYVYKAWTHPDHRRRRVSRLGSHYRYFHGTYPHAERSISMVATHNYPSLLHGYRYPSARSIAMGYNGWITVFGRQIPINSRRARWLGFIIVRKDDDRPRQYV